MLLIPVSVLSNHCVSLISFFASIDICCVFWLNDTCYSKSVWRSE